MNDRQALVERWQQFFASYRGGPIGWIGWRLRWLLAMALYDFGSLLQRL